MQYLIFHADIEVDMDYEDDDNAPLIEGSSVDFVSKFGCLSTYHKDAAMSDDDSDTTLPMVCDIDERIMEFINSEEKSGKGL